MKPKQRVYDSIHGFIYLNEWEGQLIDSFAFQRLHYIRQLGSAYLVYPGAVHSRFEHSLGVMKIATQIFDKLLEKETFFVGHEDLEYWRQVLRLSALVHDLGHLPFSHSAENALLGEGGHEKWTLAVVHSAPLKPIWDALKRAYPSKAPVGSVIKVSLGSGKVKEIGEGSLSFSPIEKVLSEIITGDFFGADRIDYLLRDAKYTGLSYGAFDYQQLIEMIAVVPGDKEGKWLLGVEENGIESCEALLLARHFMYRRIYEYPSIKAYSFHLRRFMVTMYGESDFQTDISRYLHFTDNEVLSTLNQAASDSSHRGHIDARAFFMGEKRFRAYPITKSTSQDDLLNFQKENEISKDKISWEFSKSKREKIGLNFPALLKSGSIVSAGTLSELLIPASPRGWLYLSPEIPPPNLNL